MLFETGNKTLYYDIKGSGSNTLLFVHGWMMNCDVWQKQVQFFSGFCQVITLDLSGYGRSSKTEGQNYTPELWLEDINQLLEHLNIDQITLVGWSMGGAIAIKYAVTFPQHVSKLIIVGSTPLLTAEKEVYEHAVPPQMLEQLEAILVDNFAQATKHFIDLIFREGVENRIKGDFYTFTQNTTAKIAVESLQNSGSEDLRPLLQQIAAPTLILHGEEDNICPPSASETLLEQIPDSQLVTFPNKGHAPFITAETAFNHALETFIRD